MEEGVFLQVTNLSKAYGGLLALKELSFSVRRGETTGIIGPNGAGKSTLVDLVTGFQRPSAGNVFFEGRKIDGLAPHKVFWLGIARTFQLSQFFRSFSVFDTVLVAGLGYYDASTACRQAEMALELTGLGEKRNLSTRSLTPADLKFLELARIMVRPQKLLILDESMAGLGQGEIETMSNLIKSRREAGVTFVIIEHVMSVIVDLCDHVIALDFGEKIVEGTVQEVLSDERVRKAYLGKEA